MDIQPDRSYPKIVTFVTGTGFQVVFTLLTLCLTLFYNVAYFFYVPATGVWLDYADQDRNSAIVYSLSPGGPGEKAGLQVGDKIVTIDGRAITNLNIPIHQPKKAGEVEVYVVERNQQTLTLPLQVGSYIDHLDYLADVIPQMLLSILVYFLGLTLLFFSPTTDIRARLVAMIWVLAGVALAATGPGYIGCVWFAPDVAILTFAFSIFISVAAHLYFPVPTFSNRTRSSLIWALLGLSIILAAVYLAQQISFAVRNQTPPASLSGLVIRSLFFLSWLVNIGLLLKNRFFVKDREIRRQTGIIFWGTLIGFLPFLLLSELPRLIFGYDSKLILLPSNISILSLVFVPISYGYVIYQRKLLKIDLIINRALVLFLLILIILFGALTILGLISIFIELPSQVAIAGSLLCVVVALPSAALQKRIQMQVDRVLYGGYYDYTTVTSDLSNRLAQASDRPTFSHLLTCELQEKMKIEKSAVLLLAGNRLELQPHDSSAFSVLLNDEICEIFSATRRPVRAQNLWNLVSPEASERWSPLAWAQLFVPIIHQDTLYGVLILGDRATGDIYSNQDLQIVGTVGQQAALSIANITLIETLRGLAQQMVRSDEEQRKKLARDLHDSVLQGLFIVKQNLAQTAPETAEHLNKIITVLLQTIKAQRPSLLNRGLILALQDLINDLKELAGDNIAFLWRDQVQGEISLSDEQATSIYRIVQESLSNVIKHAQADQAIITVRKENGYLEIQIEDNGAGMASKSPAQGKHGFGLAGMKERAIMIGADLSITSEPGSGTMVRLRVKV